MAEKKVYPPKEIEPYQSITLTGDDGEITFIGVNDKRVIEFIQAYAELRYLAGLAGMVDSDTRARKAAEVEEKFKNLPTALLRDIVASSQGRIIL